ncbi:MAG TPA: type 1 glutamine amidotransferase [Microbacteriaceae bacterium]|nr:type 1 glutamine amidotransferase [Microbacteriaceae bacterium]
MRALILAHDHVSPAGPVGDRLAQLGFDIDYRVVVSQENFEAPNVTFEFPDVREYDVIVPLGAPWGAWDNECIGNWLEPELEWVAGAVRSGKPVLGICFGGQLMARALGGSVARAPHNEIGWVDVWSDRPELVPGGAWFQFHYDRWVVPPGATEIARNPMASQAFVIERSLALQFHPELNHATLVGWLEWGGRSKVEEDGQDPDVMLAQTAAYESVATQRTYALVDAFLRDVAGLTL